MAIIKRAKNLIVNIKNEYRHFSGSYECVSDEVQIIATEGNLTLTSAKKIAVKKGSDNTTAKSVVEQDKKQRRISSNYQPVNGCFYTADGTFLGKEYFYIGDPNDVYICTGKEFIKVLLPIDPLWEEERKHTFPDLEKKENVPEGYFKYKDLKKLTIKGVDIKNDTFLRIAGLAYSEVGYNSEAIKRIPYIIMNRNIQNNEEDFHRGESIDDTIREIRGRKKTEWKYFNGNDAYKIFLGYDTKHKAKEGDIFDYDRNAFGRNSLVITQKKLAKLAIEYTIKAFYYLNEEPPRRNDLSEGAIGWHGIDILKIHKDNTYWQENLFIKIEHRVGGFSAWNFNDKKDKSSFEYITTSVYKGVGNLPHTIFYKKQEKKTYKK